MIDIVTVDFSIGVGPLGERLLRRRAREMFDAWDSELGSTLPLPDYALYFELEEGSLNGKGKVAAGAFAVYIAIGQFGSFVSGVKEINHYARAGGSILLAEARHLVPPGQNAEMRSRRGTGQLGQLERLFQRVYNHELAPMEAAEAARELFQGQPDLPEEALKKIEEELLSTRRRPTQLGLVLNDRVLEPEDADKVPEKKGRKPTGAIPPVPPPERFRVAIWRESRKGKRHIDVETL